MKKITFVCNHLFGGGAERVLASLANCFKEKGYQVTIVVFDGSRRYPINADINVIEIGNTSSLLTQSLAIRRKLKRIRPDIIIAFEYFVNMATIIAAFGLRAKVIVSERNDPARVGSGIGKNQLRNILYRYCDALVCQTPDARDYFPKEVQDHSLVIPNPVKDGLPEPFHGKRKHQIVNFCRLNKQKNLKLLVDAFSDFYNEFEDYRLVIYGDGQERENISRYISEKDMESVVELRSNISDVHAPIIDSAMFVSSSDYEGLSNSMLEAMAIGLPVICTDCPCGGARMMIKDGVNGLLVPVGDRRGLASAMKRVAGSDVLADSLSGQGVKVRDDMSLDKIAMQWEALFSVLEKNC